MHSVENIVNYIQILSNTTLRYIQTYLCLLSKGSNNIFLPYWVIKPLTLKITNASIKFEKEKTKLRWKIKQLSSNFQVSHLDMVELLLLLVSLCQNFIHG